LPAHTETILVRQSTAAERVSPRNLPTLLWKYDRQTPPEGEHSD